MRKWVYIVVAALFVGGLELAMRGRTRAREPVYYGKPFGHWIRHPEDHSWTSSNSSEGLVRVDSRAIPYKDQFLSRSTGHALLRSGVASPEVMALARKSLTDPNHYVRNAATNFLQRFSPATLPKRGSGVGV
jgi:hypothetical protein